MRMEVAHWRMCVRMVVGLSPIPRKVVLMLMMFVMNMRVGVTQRRVFMRVLVVFGEMQPDANPHQDDCQPERWRCRFAEQRDAQGGADEWRGGKICASACSAQIPQGAHEEGQAHTIAEPADQHCRGHDHEPGRARRGRRYLGG